MRAQLALVIAIAARPKVLVLDDPAAGLDAVVRRELLEMLVDLVADGECTIFLSSHILADIERIADRVGVLQAGHLVVDETVERLKTRVQRRRVRTPSGALPDLPGLLSARPLADGFVLTLVDVDAEREARLAAAVDAASPPEVPSLEEFFIELVRGEAPAARGDVS
jgi:ABC-2 type transport system ATP-binding protein